MSELAGPEYTEEPNHNQSRPLDTMLQVLPEEIPVDCDPMKAPQNFYTWLVGRLEGNGVGLMPPDNPGMYEPTELMLFCGFDAADLQQNGTFGDRRETWGIRGGEFKEVARAAAATGEWPVHSPIWYAKNENGRESAPKTPAIAVFDGKKMLQLHNRDKSRHQDEYGVLEGSMDEAAVAVIYLP